MSGRIVQMSNVLMNNKNVHFQSFYSIAIVRVVVRNALSSSIALVQVYCRNIVAKVL